MKSIFGHFFSPLSSLPAQLYENNTMNKVGLSKRPARHVLGAARKKDQNFNEFKNLYRFENKLVYIQK